MTSSTSADTIQRVLFICSKVHVYSIPPLASNKGYVAAGWTDNDNAREIFVARLRVLETAILPPPSTPEAPEKVSIEVLLEDAKTGELFAGAPYNSKTVVEAAIDSSRFFAVRVVGDGGQRATLGIGFEDRSDAIDFGICLQESRKVLDSEPSPQVTSKVGAMGAAQAGAKEGKRDWSLKDGQTIRVDVGKKGRRKEAQAVDIGNGPTEDPESALFSIKPPPNSEDRLGGSTMPTLGAPPSAQEARAQKRRSRGISPGKLDAKQLGFDDGEFGEFQ